MGDSDPKDGQGAKPSRRETPHTSVWGNALSTWPVGEDTISRESFADYLKEHDLPKKATAAALSIQSFAQLPRELRDQDIMVFRRGRGRFALVRAKSNAELESLFLFDKDLFAQVTARDIDTSNKKLLGMYSLSSRQSETNLINLSLASGALAQALDLDDAQPLPPLATAQSTYSFTFRPFQSRPEELQHVSGQVEVDGLFVARRQGQLHLFVLEAKKGKKSESMAEASLAKTKLAYACIAISQSAPSGLPIVPIYMRASWDANVAEYQICRCREYDTQEAAIDAIQPDHTDSVRVEVPSLASAK